MIHRGASFSGVNFTDMSTGMVFHGHCLALSGTCTRARCAWLHTFCFKNGSLLVRLHCRLFAVFLSVISYSRSSVCLGAGFGLVSTVSDFATVQSTELTMDRVVVERVVAGNLMELYDPVTTLTDVSVVDSDFGVLVAFISSALECVCGGWCAACMWSTGPVEWGDAERDWGC